VKRSSLLVLVVLLASCESRDRLAQPDTIQARPAPVVPERSAYLSVSDLAPEAGGIIVVAGTVAVGGDLTLGSFRVRIGYDSTKLHFIDEVPAGGIMRVVNPKVGDIVVVGAAPEQSLDSTLFVMRFRADDPAGINSLVLRIDELNDGQFKDRKEAVTRASRLVLDSSLAGRSIPTSASGATAVSGRSAASTLARNAGMPTIDSISPRTGELDNERVTDVTLYGRGFAPRGNLVRFGDREIPGLMSERNGTVIRFPAPVLRVHEGWVPVRVVRDGCRATRCRSW
jgi:hypothetical protein